MIFKEKYKNVFLELFGTFPLALVGLGNVYTLNYRL